MKKLLLTLFISFLFIRNTQAQVIISEIMYNPALGTALDEQNYEFLEITNIGSSSVDISGYTFTQGIVFTFPANTILNTNQRIVLVRDAATFSQRYPNASAFGTYTGGLSNSGETLTLADGALNTIFEVTYDDVSPWPVLADGEGFSLVPVNEASTTSPASADYWTTSANINGSPGTEETIPTEMFEVYVNELLSAPSMGNLDKVELYNNSNDTVYLSNWYLTDDRKNPKGYKFPNNAKIAPKGYYVLNENNFNFLDAGFSFSSKGDEVYIFAGNSNNQLTGYSHGFSFMAQLEDVSFGRVVNSQGKEYFVRQSAQTFGTENAAAKVGPVVIEKIMYNPDLQTDEFLVLTNISNERVELATTALVDSNVYRVSGVTFKFPEPSNTFLESGQSIILTSIAINDFRTKYNIDNTIQIFTFTGALNNGGENITIETPIYRDTLLDNSFDNHYMIIDEVEYGTMAPWPSVAANTKYLQRVNLSGFGSEAQNWIASNAPIVTGISSSVNTTNGFAYPTTVENELHIENKDIISISLLNTTGQLVREYQNIDEVINVQPLESGFYIVKGITSKNEVVSMKIVKK